MCQGGYAEPPSALWASMLWHVLDSLCFRFHVDRNVFKTIGVDRIFFFFKPEEEKILFLEIHVYVWIKSSILWDHQGQRSFYHTTWLAGGRMRVRIRAMLIQSPFYIATRRNIWKVIFLMSSNICFKLWQILNKGLLVKCSENTVSL